MLPTYLTFHPDPRVRQLAAEVRLARAEMMYALVRAAWTALRRLPDLVRRSSRAAPPLAAARIRGPGQ